LSNLLEKIEQKEKEIKKLRKAISDKEKEVEKKTDEKIELLTEEEVKELLLEKFFEIIQNQLEKYLNEEKKELIKIFESLWDKYKVSLSELRNERDEEVKKLDEFLKRLGYSYE
jgi:type I restriction enzyme M protein